MRFLKFLLPTLLIIGLPLLGLISNSYVFVNSFPYGTHVHSSVATANFLFKALLIIGVAGLVVGLVNPKIVYFSTLPTRKNVVIYYTFILLLSFVSYRELIFLYKFTAETKKPALSEFFNEVVVGEATKSLISKIQKFEHPLQWWESDSSNFNRTVGFPYSNPTAMIIQIHFPGLTQKSSIVVEISDSFGSDNSQVIRSVLIENNRVILSNPILTPEDPQILMGTFENIDEKLMFKACGETQSIETDLSKLKERSIFNFVDKGVFGKRFAIFSGSILNTKICSSCSENTKTLYVYHGVLSHDEKSYSCESGF
jgi:hypothetical protein